MVLASPEGGDDIMRVTMKDHAFGLPLDCHGEQVQLEGEIVEKEINPAVVAHYKSESKNPEATPEDNAVDGKSYELVAATGSVFR